jgi:dipeptide/tripeptide permease
MQTSPTVIPDQQPQGLYLLFFTELWERFGFYTLQTIIVLCMTKSLLMFDNNANTFSIGMISFALVPYLKRLILINEG